MSVFEEYGAFKWKCEEQKSLSESAYLFTWILSIDSASLDFFLINSKYCKQGPVVQRVVSLTSSLRVILLTVLADLIDNILIFFAEKMWVACALQKLLTFFQQKISAYLRIT